MKDLLNIIPQKRYPRWTYYLTVLFMSIIPLFYQLGTPVLNIWDESRRAINACEMAENGHLFITYFDGEPEMWGTKPPLLTWLQVLSLKVFGFNEWAIRFPSALAGLLTGFLMIWFSFYFTRSYSFGLIGVLILYTSRGYLGIHSARTGDYDALLLLFTTAASMLLFIATEINRQRENKYLFLFFIALTLATLTKGVAGLLFLPAYAVYVLYRRKAILFLRSPSFWYGAGLFVVVIGGYYLARELFNPGYLHHVMNNEVAGRYFETLEENTGPFYFYIRRLYQYRFSTWLFLVPVGVVFGLLSKDKRMVRLIVYFLGLTLSYLLVISMSKTKLIWYDMQMYTYLSLLSSLFFYFILKWITDQPALKDQLVSPNLIAILLLVAFFAQPYNQVFKNHRKGELLNQNPDRHYLSKYMKSMIEKDEGLTGHQSLNIVYKPYFQQYLFYAERLKILGTDVQFFTPAEVQPGNTYLLSSPAALEHIQEACAIEQTSLTDHIYLLRVKECPADSLVSD